MATVENVMGSVSKYKDRSVSLFKCNGTLNVHLLVFDVNNFPPDP